MPTKAEWERRIDANPRPVESAPSSSHCYAAIGQSERDEIKAELIRMRQYVMRKGLGIGECVAWCKIKERFGIGIRDADDEQWLKDYESRKQAEDWPSPCRHGVKGPCGECRA